MNYVTYHLHTELSLLDSCTNYKLYINKAKDLGQIAICFTEHGNTFNWIEKKTYCEGTQYKLTYKDKEIFFENKKKLDIYLKDYGIKNDECEIKELPPIKYLHGIECYLTQNSIYENKIKDNYHTVLIARNMDGFKELNTLISRSYDDDHFYYKPRITFDEFFNISDNIIKISACLASPLRLYTSSVDVLDRLFRTYDYYEIQPHVYSEEQKKYNKLLFEMSKKYDKPLIAGTDTHSIDNYKAECRIILKKSNKMLHDNEDDFDLTYKSYDELVDMFKEQGVLDKDVYLEAIKNTNKMALSVEDFELDKSFKYPVVSDNSEEELKQLINEKFKDKVNKGIIKNDRRYRENVVEELRVFKKIGMIDFILFMSKLVSWCWDENIPVGFCRGSVGGSTIAYLIDIIDVDPVKWNTVFSRFANEDREELGDIDIDFAPSDREKVYKHIISEYGEDKTAYILTTNRIVEKGTIDLIGRALEIPLPTVEMIKDEYDLDKDYTRNKYPKLFYFFDGLLGTVVSRGVHPAGITVSPITLDDNYGTIYDSKENKKILCINMEEIHEVSLVKYDILGLKNVEIIKDTCELCGIPYPKSHEIDWNDEQVWKHIIDIPYGIFQFESPYAFSCLRKFRPFAINDLSLVNAALRPSGESYRDRLLNHEINKNPSEMIDDLLKDNKGFLVFQEDTIKFLTDICGLKGSEADNVRRAIGRKQYDRLKEALPDILDGYCENSDKPRNIAENEAKTFLKIIEDSSNYQFGYNHSTGYSMIGYLCGYLRYYHPAEFATAYLNNASNKDDIKMGYNLCKFYKLEMKDIKFRKSRGKYNIEKGCIYKGISSIKFLSDDDAESLYSLKDNYYDDFVDLLEAINNLEGRKISKRTKDILIKLNFFEEFGTQPYLLKQAELFDHFYKKKKVRVDTLGKKGYNVNDLEGCYEKRTEKQLSGLGLNWKKIVYRLSEPYKDKKMPLKQILLDELEYYGYVNTTRDIPDVLFVQEITDHSKFKGVVLYEVSTGRTADVRIDKAVYNSQRLEKGDFIKAEHTMKKNRYKYCGVGEKGKPVYKLIDGEYNYYLTRYSIVNLNKLEKEKNENNIIDNDENEINAYNIRKVE